MACFLRDQEGRWGVAWRLRLRKAWNLASGVPGGGDVRTGPMMVATSVEASGTMGWRDGGMEKRGGDGFQGSSW